jgi:hypothetical protein
MSDLWLIYSNEHRAWWGPGRHGYTIETERAGRYSFAEAMGICLQANVVPRDPPNEVMVLAPMPTIGLTDEEIMAALRAAGALEPPKSFRDMTEEEIMAAALSDPDNLPLTEEELRRLRPRKPR